MSTWVKVHDTLRGNPKSLAAGDRAMWLYVCGLSYANEQETDGFVARIALPAVAPGVKFPERLAAKLVEVEYWHVVDGGWEINDYLEFQRSAAEIKASGTASRASNAERQQRYRAKLKESGVSRSIPGETRKSVWERDGGKCVSCGTTAEPLEMHHRLPVTEGGDHSANNLELRCRSCHRGHAGHASAGHAGHADVTLLDKKREETEQRTTTPLSAAPTDVDRVFQAWLVSTGRTAKTVLSPKRRRLIQSALRSYSVEDVVAAVEGWRRSKHHRGENAQKTVYNNIELLLRDSEHIEMFRDLARADLSGAGGGWEDSGWFERWNDERSRLRRGEAS